MTRTTSYQRQVDNGVLRTGTLFAATITTGLLAGVFADWSNAIMPGLGNVDDRTLVMAFRALDEAITSPLFLGGIAAALLLIGVAVALHFRTDHWPVLMWTGAALVFYLVVLTITFGVHEPLNEKLRSAGGLTTDADFAAARAPLEEATWTTWNTARAVACTASFGCLCWALVIHRRFGKEAAG